MKRIVVSQRLRVAARLSDIPLYRLAIAAGTNPSTIYKVFTGILPTSREDERVTRIGKILGISEQDCFEEEAIR